MRKRRKPKAVKIPIGQAELIYNLLGVSLTFPTMSESAIQILLQTIDKCKARLNKRIEKALKHERH